MTKTGIERVVSGYERARHGEAAARVAQQLDDEFIDRFAVAGSPEVVRDRLAEICAAGIGRLVVVPGSLDSEPAAVRRSMELFAEHVLPELMPYLTECYSPEAECTIARGTERQ